MAQIDSGSKSSRLLASRRYTHDTLTTAQESFTNVLDLREEEIYTQGSYIPSSGLPFSGSADVNQTHTVSGSSVLKYWYRHKLTKSDTNNEVWFFLDPAGSDDGVGAQLINDNQEVNFVSPKYAVSSLATSTVEDTTPGYLAVLYKSTAVSQSAQTSSLSSGDKISTNDYIFDYKTGVVQFMNSSVDPTDSQYVFMSVYQYTGTTLSTGVDIRGDISASNAKFTSVDISGGTISATLSGALSSSVQIESDISGSWQGYITGSGIVSGSVQIEDDISGSLSQGHLSSKVSDIVSGSIQLASDISGSLSQAHLSSKISNIVSGSVQIEDDISGSLSQAHLSSKISNIVSGSVQIESDISGSWQGFITGSGIVSGSSMASSAQGQVTLTTNGVAASAVDLGLQTTDSPTFSGLTVEGDLTAQQYIVSSSVTYTTQSFSSGSTIFGDDITDTHQFTGSISISGSYLGTSLVSGSGQVVSLLPSGTMSGSGQLPSGTMSGSGQLPSGVISGSSQLSQGFGNISGSLTSTGSFGKVLGDGSDLENLPSDPSSIAMAIVFGG